MTVLVPQVVDASPRFDSASEPLVVNRVTYWFPGETCGTMMKFMVPPLVCPVPLS